MFSFQTLKTKDQRKGKGVIKMTVKHTFFVGLNDKDSKVQEFSALEAAKIVQRVFCKNSCDCTISDGQGVYTHNDGTITTENTLIVTVFEFGEPVNVKAICDDLKTMLNQESIAVETTETMSALY